MKSFEVLDRQLPIHQSYFLEASAGTGKTFSIENIFVRLLIEPSPNEESLIGLDSILAVTFTRAAALELKVRIRKNIESAIAHLTAISEEMPDYLLAIHEQGAAAVIRAKHALERAISRFEEAQIFTIHGFCARMLSEYGLETSNDLQFRLEEELFSSFKLEEMIRDFLRNGIRLEQYSLFQLQRVMQKGIDFLVNSVSQLIHRGKKILAPPSFAESFNAFQKQINQLSIQFAPSLEKILEDVGGLSKCYKMLNEEKIEEVRFFVSLLFKESLTSNDFEKILETEFLSLWTFENRKVKNKLDELHYPSFFELACKALEPILELAKNELGITARIARDCMEILEERLKDDEVFSPDDILKKMHRSLSSPIFLAKMQSKFQAAIIDEFQDTDFKQWEIFQKCFLSDSASTYCYLVGDPKQSIYAFRQADIYTYLKAADWMGRDCRASLRTNYRSQPQLVHALNTLLNGSNEFWMPLPKLGATLPIEHVNASLKRIAKEFKDEKKSIHAFIATEESCSVASLRSSERIEEELFFPFIANEIIYLSQEEGFSLDSMAVLIKDRYQAKRLQDFLNAHGIASITKRSTSLIDSTSFNAFEDLLKVVLNPSQLSHIRLVLGGKILGGTEAEIRSMQGSEVEEKLISQLYRLQDIWHNGSFAFFYHALMYQMKWFSDQAIGLALLQRSDGEALYLELNQIADLLIEEEARNCTTPEVLLEYLQQLKKIDPEEDCLKMMQIAGKNAVQILTQHVSKGLEFEIVFALGLVSAAKVKKAEIVPLRDLEGHVALRKQGDDDYRMHYEEIDAEKMRQLYVVMTRARERLYIPVLLEADPKEKVAGEPSAMDLFLSKQIGESVPLILEFLKPLLDQWHESSDFSYELIGPTSVEKYKPLDEEKKIPHPCAFEAVFKEEKIHSFTSLAVPKNLIRPNAPMSFPESGSPVLPRGAVTGELVHKIIQEIPLQLLIGEKGVKNPHELNPHLRPFLVGSLLEQHAEAITEMVFNAFKIRLKAGERSFSLDQLDPSKIIREMEFLFQSHQESYCEGITMGEELMTGSIDFVFQHEGLIYFVDWKTHWIGSETECYHQENLKKVMEADSYFLQSEIYAGAVKKYFKIFDDRPFEDYFGGAFYIFLRGINPLKDSQEGVFYIPPSYFSKVVS